MGPGMASELPFSDRKGRPERRAESDSGDPIWRTPSLSTHRSAAAGLEAAIGVWRRGRSRHPQAPSSRERACVWSRVGHSDGRFWCFFHSGLDWRFLPGWSWPGAAPRLGGERPFSYEARQLSAALTRLLEGLAEPKRPFAIKVPIHERTPQRELDLASRAETPPERGPHRVRSNHVPSRSSRPKA